MAINKEIGEKISSLRALKRIEAEDLAKKAGLSIQQLNHIESGISIPSLGVLIRISRALGVRMGTLLDDTIKEGPAIVRADERQSTLSFSTSENENREHLLFLSLAPNKTGRHMEPFLIDILPLKNDQTGKSSHEGEEFIYVLEGQVIVYYGKNTFVIEKGDSIYLDSIVPHLVTTNSSAKILAIVYVPV
jgi:transcriptional regulator with XRE-family HTH domain